MNNNDISLFEKVAFVNNIPDEGDAYKLSQEYPFAIIITDTSDAGIVKGIAKGVSIDNETGKQIEYLNTDVINEPSGNIWLGGQRLTKFINIDNNRHVIPMDTYSIVLNFNQITGLLSLYTEAKIEDFELSTVFFKDIFGKLHVFINKEKLRTEYNGTVDDDGNNVAGVVDTTDADTNSFFGKHILGTIEKSTNDCNYLEFIQTEQNHGYLLKDAIDSHNNAIYVILRFESSSESALGSLDNTTFNIINMYSNYEPSSNGSQQFCEFFTRQFLNRMCGTTTKMNYGNDYTVYASNTDWAHDCTFTQQDMNDIAAATINLKYRNQEDGGRKPGKYIIYKINLLEGTKIDSNSQLTIPYGTSGTFPISMDTKLDFQFNALSSDFAGFRMSRGWTYINPIVNPYNFNLYINKNGKEELVDAVNGKIFIMPGETIQFSYYMEPEHVQDLKLYIYCDKNYSSFTVNNQRVTGNSAEYIYNIDENDIVTNCLGFNTPLFTLTSTKLNGVDTGIAYNYEYNVGTSGEKYSNKFTFEITASKDFTYKNIYFNNVPGGINTGNATEIPNPPSSRLRFVLVKQETYKENGINKTRNIKLFDSGATYSIYRYTYEGLQIGLQNEETNQWENNLSWGINVGNDSNELEKMSGQILQSMNPGIVYAIFSDRTSAADPGLNNIYYNLKEDNLGLNSKNDNNINNRLQIIFNIMDNPGYVNTNGSRRINHETLDLDVNGIVSAVGNNYKYTNYDNLFPAQLYMGYTYDLRVPYIYRTYMPNSSNNNYINYMQLSYNYRGNLDSSLLRPNNDGRDKDNSIKVMYIRAAQIKQIAINGGITLSYYHNNEEIPYDGSNSIPTSGEKVKFIVNTNLDTNKENIQDINQNAVTIELAYPYTMTDTATSANDASLSNSYYKLNAFKYVFIDNNQNFSISKLKDAITIGKKQDNVIINQNTDELNTNSFMRTDNSNQRQQYLTIENDNLYYNSSVDNINNYEIYYNISITDPNYLNNFNSPIVITDSESKKILFKNYKTRWLMYLEAAENPNNNPQDPQYKLTTAEWKIYNRSSDGYEDGLNRYNIDITVPSFNHFTDDFSQVPNKRPEGFIRMGSDGPLDPSNTNSVNNSSNKYSGGWTYLGVNTIEGEGEILSTQYKTRSCEILTATSESLIASGQVDGLEILDYENANGQNWTEYEETKILEWHDELLDVLLILPYFLTVEIDNDTLTYTTPEKLDNTITRNSMTFRYINDSLYIDNGRYNVYHIIDRGQHSGILSNISILSKISVKNK